MSREREGATSRSGPSSVTFLCETYSQALGVSRAALRWSNKADNEERRRSIITSEHRLIEDGSKEAAIGAFLFAHEGHTQDVDVQRGGWTVYCRCARCEDIRTYEVDNEARERALGLPPWPAG